MKMASAPYLPRMECLIYASRMSPLINLRHSYAAFVDVDDRNSGIPETLIGHKTKLFIVFVTSPMRQRWKRLSKCMNHVVIIMNPWSLEEMRQA